jgi:hypothetical protein
MDRKRIQVYADPETKRRIELAAAQHAVAVTEYCLGAIKQQLLEDDLLDAQSIEILVKPVRETILIAELRKLQRQINTDRNGKPIDLDVILAQVRDEREHELHGLR